MGEVTDLINSSFVCYVNVSALKSRGYAYKCCKDEAKSDEGLHKFDLIKNLRIKLFI